TRLTAHGVEDAHGNVVVAWFWDTELEVRCTPQNATDGVLRCLPEATPVPVGFGAALYGDVDCEDPIVLSKTPCGTGYGIGSTTAGNVIYDLGPSYVTVYQWDVGRGECGGAVVPAGYTPYAEVVLPP